MCNTVSVKCYVGKQKCFNHDLSAVDIPFFEMILH